MPQWLQLRMSLLLRLSTVKFFDQQQEILCCKCLRALDKPAFIAHRGSIFVSVVARKEEMNFDTMFLHLALSSTSVVRFVAFVPLGKSCPVVFLWYICIHTGTRALLCLYMQNSQLNWRCRDKWKNASKRHCDIIVQDIKIVYLGKSIFHGGQ